MAITISSEGWLKNFPVEGINIYNFNRFYSCQVYELSL